MDTMPIDAPRQAGLYVRRSREAQRLTRAQLARAAGVSERSLASLELGDATGIRLDKLLAVLEALGLSLVVQGEDIAGGGGVAASGDVRRARPDYWPAGIAGMQANGRPFDLQDQASIPAYGMRAKSSPIAQAPAGTRHVSEAKGRCGIEEYQAALRDFIINDMGVLLADEVR